ncbi:MAG: isoleucine--tRNA ligase, partial [Prolixibacteraceae bacterium]|nr:isoleucine--tRNA ligase [Prolixibacteraceae bacterium]
KMTIAQKASCMILALRRKEKLKVRQPLGKIMVPVLNARFQEQFDAVKNIILTEVNVKEVKYITDTAGIIKKKIKPDFKILGPKYGKLMKQIAKAISGFSQDDISALENSGSFEIVIGDETIVLSPEDLQIQTEDIPGWTVATEGQLTIALDINVTEELKQEGIAREFINKIQNLRKEINFEVTDHIHLTIQKQDFINDAVLNHKEYICTQTLANGLELVDKVNEPGAQKVEIDKNVTSLILIKKLN